MTLDQLMAEANAAYDDGAGEDLIAQIWAKHDEDHHVESDVGDTLALFVVRELRDTFDPAATDVAQLREADRVLTTAYRQLLDMSVAFSDAAGVLEKKT